MPAPKGKPQVKINQEMYALVIKALMTEPQTFDMLQELTGLHRVTLYRLFRTFKKHDIVHISGWEQDRRGRDMFAVYTFGKGKDAAKFRMSRNEIAKRYREKQKRKAATAVIDNIIKGVKNAKRTNTEPCAA